MNAFIHFIGDGGPAGFVANELDAFGPRVACEACGRGGGDGDRPLVAPLRIDEDLMAEWSAGHVAPIDVVNLMNGGRLVSKRFAAELASRGATGFTLHPVECAGTGLPSEQYFLLAATIAVVDLCPVHSRMTVKPCSECGDFRGPIGGERHVDGEIVRGVDIFSRHRYGLADLYMSRDLYAHLTAAKMGLVSSVSLDLCHHEHSASHARAARPVAAPTRHSPPPRPECSVSDFMRFVRAPRPTADCRRRGSGTECSTRTFELSHLVEPGAKPAKLNALEKQLPDVAHLRALALQADGLLLFFQGEPPSTFPTRAAVRRTQGEVFVPAALQFEKVCDWRYRHEEMQKDLVHLDGRFLGAHGIPFATIVGSPHSLVCADGLIYYYSATGTSYHNQVIARSLEQFLGIVTTSLAAFLHDGASVTTYYDSDWNQYYPEVFHVSA